LSKHQVMPSPESRKPRFFYGYVIVLAVFFIFAVLDGTMYSFGVFLKPLTVEFGWTRAITSGVFSVHMFLCGFLYIVTGSLNDRFGPRVVLTICGFLYGLGYLLMSQANTLWQLYLFYGVLTAMGVSGGFVPLPSTVARWFAKRRGMMTGVAVSGIGAGTIIMPPVASQLIASYGWRTSYLFIGSIALIFIIVAAQFLRRDPSQKGLSPFGRSEVGAEILNFEAEGASLLQAIRIGQFWMLSIMNFCFGFGLITIMTHIVPHATDLGIPPILAANIISIIGGVSIAGRIVIGIASDRIGGKISIIIGFILLLVAFLWLLTAKELWMLNLFAIILGFAYGGLVALISPILAELFGLKAHGAIMGIVVFAWTMGGAAGPVVAGHIFDITSSYYLAFLVCTILSFIGLILALLLKPIRRESLV